MAADNENQEAEDESEEEDVEPEVAVKDNDTELEAAIAAIRANKDLPRPPYPTLPNLNSAATMSAKVSSVQTYIEKLSYNFTGVNYFDVRKHRPLGRILETGREITRQALPIKCVEAVFVAMYLTQGVKDLERIPMSFKSMVDGVTYKHIVLVLKHNSKWGTVGLSRRRELYCAPLSAPHLALPSQDPRPLGPARPLPHSSPRPLASSPSPPPGAPLALPPPPPSTQEPR